MIRSKLNLFVNSITPGMIKILNLDEYFVMNKAGAATPPTFPRRAKRLSRRQALLDDFLESLSVK